MLNSIYYYFLIQKTTETDATAKFEVLLFKTEHIEIGGGIWLKF